MNGPRCTPYALAPWNRTIRSSDAERWSRTLTRLRSSQVGSNLLSRSGAVLVGREKRVRDLSQVGELAFAVRAIEQVDVSWARLEKIG